MDEREFFEEQELEQKPEGKVVWLLGVYSWAGNRPRFTDLVKKTVFPAPQDRCHSASWEMLRCVTTDILTSGHTGNKSEIKRVKAALQFLTNTMLGLDALNTAIAQAHKKTYRNDLIEKSQILQRGFGRYVVVEEATAYLKTLNSCICNLRYPAVAAYNWNQSVGGGYDPRQWCYVDRAGNVVSSENGVLNPPTPIASYPAFANKPALAGSGYYLLDPFDEYLLTRFFDQKIAGLLMQPRLYIYHGTDAAGNGVMASSSNTFPIINVDPDDADVYFDIGGSWQAL